MEQTVLIHLLGGLHHCAELAIRHKAQEPSELTASSYLVRISIKIMKPSLNQSILCFETAINKYLPDFSDSDLTLLDTQTQLREMQLRTIAQMGIITC